ncbi:2-hydroxyacid dehydrogenase [Pedobacter sp. P351]|uniref:2-hydroxyacid dehydrogenase n=1 Tax=Pedobacter superstes TaxID=3133441 RepID=UPI0030AAF675
MKVLIYSTKDFERSYLISANKMKHELTCVTEALSLETAALGQGFEAVVVFTGDDISTAVVEKLNKVGVKYIAVRAVGYDNVDIKRAGELGMKVANVPEYSPYAIAEHTIALILALNRKLILADKQVHNLNFKVDNLVGFDLHQKTVGIIGTGKIGSVVAKILNGFGCRLLGYDLYENKELIEKYNLEYVDLKTICRLSDIISLHTPLNSATKYLIDKKVLDIMKTGVMIINTSRGAVINTEHIIVALENGKIGYLGLDVYEREKGIFFYDHSLQPLKDEVLKKLMSNPNVIITPHQAFATKDALENIANTTFYNIDSWAQKKKSDNELTPEVYAEHV